MLGPSTLLLPVLAGCEFTEDEYWQAYPEAVCAIELRCTETHAEFDDEAECVSYFEPRMDEAMENSNVVCYSPAAAEHCIQAALAVDETCTDAAAYWSRHCDDVYQLRIDIGSGTVEPRCED